VPELTSKRSICLVPHQAAHELGLQHPSRPARQWGKDRHRAAINRDHDMFTGLDASQQSTRVVPQLP
jgi:hypothetical protein